MNAWVDGSHASCMFVWWWISVWLCILVCDWRFTNTSKSYILADLFFACLWSLLAYLPYFVKIKVGLCYLCLWIPFLNLRKPEPVFIKLGIYIMGIELILSAYFVNPSDLSCVSVYVTFLSLLGNGSVNVFPQQQKILESSFSMKSVSYQGEAGD
jgi:hypothetical protein